MPPRRGGAPPGPSSGPQAASPSDRLFPALLDAAVKLKPALADLDPDALRHAFRNAWLSRPPPPNDLHATSALLVSVANRLARAARRAEDPFESAASSPAPSVSPAPQRSPATADDLTLPHIDPQDVAAATPAFPAVTPPELARGPSCQGPGRLSRPGRSCKVPFTGSSCQARVIRDPPPNQP